MKKPLWVYVNDENMMLQKNSDIFRSIQSQTINKCLNSLSISKLLKVSVIFTRYED